MGKHIPRIFCESPLAAGTRLRLGDDAAHHLLNVLRLKPGAELVLFDGLGGEYAGQLHAAGKNWVEVVADTHRAVQRESTLHILLGQAVSRGERMDYTIQKAVELGVQEIQPLDTERSQGRLDPARMAKKARHWQDIARSAAEQSGRTCVPPVRPVRTLADWLPALPGDWLKLLLDPAASHGLKGMQLSGKICLLSGPEGGLGAAEVVQAQETGFTGIRLGPRILRTETAAVACLATLQALWGDLGE